MGVGEQPVPERPAFFIEILRLGDEVELRDIDPRRTDRVAELTADAEIDPLIHRGFVRFPEPLGPGAGLLRPREEGGDPGDRTDRHTGGTPDANIRMIFGPNLFYCHSTILSNECCFKMVKPISANCKSKIPISKFQINPKIQNLMTQTTSFRILNFEDLVEIWCLVFGAYLTYAPIAIWAAVYPVTISIPSLDFSAIQLEWARIVPATQTFSSIRSPRSFTGRKDESMGTPDWWIV